MCFRGANMKIREVPGEQKAVITIKGPGERVDLQTKTYKSYGDTLLLDVIRKDGKIVSFKSERSDLKAELTINVNGRPMVWKDVVIDRVYFNKQFFYCVRTSNASETKERRGARRVPVTDEGFVQLNGSRGTPKVLVKDVSRTGFGIVIDKNAHINVGDVVYLTFYDEIRLGNSEIKRKDKYSFTCHVKRIEETNSDRKVLGVQIAKSEQPIAGRLVLQKMA